MKVTANGKTGNLVNVVHTGCFKNGTKLLLRRSSLWNLNYLTEKYLKKNRARGRRRVNLWTLCFQISKMRTDRSLGARGRHLF